MPDWSARGQRGRRRLGLLLEVCVDDARGLAEAVAGGADRIELCAALSVGGLTPSPGLMVRAARCGVPVMAMIRPRTGDFVYDADEVAVMQADIRAARAAGLSGVVLGASVPDGRLDRGVLAALVTVATGLDLTLHRAVDLCPDVDVAVEMAIALGFQRILTSGGALRAVEGMARLRRMITVAAGRIGIMPGSGVSVATWAILRDLAVSEVHASCAMAWPVGGQALAFGFQMPGEKRTDRREVAALKAALAG